MINIQNKNKCKGLSLIEVMVTVFVFSIGMLGLAGLQLTAMKHNSSAQFRTTAMILANDIADRARANAAGTYVHTGGNGPGLNGNCESGAGCTTAEMVNNDIQTWLDTVAATLPNGTAQICQDDDPEVPAPGAINLPAINCTSADPVNDPFVVYIDWVDEKNTANGSAPQIKRFVMNF